MESVIRNQDTRRFSERRETHAPLTKGERRRAERRNGAERRQRVAAGPAMWLQSRLPAFMQPLVVSFGDSRKSNNIYVPLWALLSIFALSVIYLIVYYGTAPMDVYTSQPQNEVGEVIVFDPSDALSLKIVQSGYAVIETMDMKDLNIRVQRLRIPSQMTVPEALTDLQNRFPGLEVDANSRLRFTDP